MLTLEEDNDKYQNSKHKINSKSQCQISKPRFCHLIFVLCHYLVICALSFGFSVDAYALNLDKLKVHFLEGDYKQAISEGEKILAQADDSRHIDELYYLLGLSYLKDGNYLRAQDIFEIILKEFKESRFREEALIGLGDTYLLKADYDSAESKYQEIIKNNQSVKLRPIVYYRLSLCALRKGDTQSAKEYLGKLKNESPLSLETQRNYDLVFSSDIYYTVQVGSFSQPTNAHNLTQRLIQKGYPAYIEEVSLTGKTSYRVRVGKLRLRQEAAELENKLSQEGYPTKIFP